MWKRANVTPVFKAEAKDVIENYRPISLLSIPSKCLEKIVHKAIYSHVPPYLTGWQHGFILKGSLMCHSVSFNKSSVDKSTERWIAGERRVPRLFECFSNAQSVT